MPIYEFKCPEHGIFDLEFRMADMPQSASCHCGVDSPKQFSLFGNISTSDDPSFGSSRNQKRNREYQGFDPNKHDWVERPKHDKSDWEYA